MSATPNSDFSGHTAIPQLPVEETKTFCPTHKFALVTMPRDEDEGVEAARGYAEKCPLRKCNFGVFRDEV